MYFLNVLQRILKEDKMKQQQQKNIQDTFTSLVSILTLHRRGAEWKTMDFVIKS